MATAALPSVFQRVDHAAIYDAALAAGRIPSIIEYMDRLPWFQTGADWIVWRVFLKGVYALPMDARELEIFRRYTGRRYPPGHQVSEVAGIVGRRGRKSAVLGLLAFYQAIRRKYDALAGGERAWSLTLSTKIDDAAKIHENVNAILNCVQLEHLRDGAPHGDTIPLRTNVDVKIRASNIKAGRGRAVVFAGLDEFAFLPTEGAKIPDEEVLRGIRPAMANVPNALLAMMSSPYAMRGEFYKFHQRYYGKDDEDNLVWRADTISMHDTEAIRVFVAKEYERDPVSAASEFGLPDKGIVFRKDVLIFISPELVDALVQAGRDSLPACSMAPAKTGEREPRRFHYFAFIDVSGGSSDSFCLAIAHWDRLIEHTEERVFPPTEDEIKAAKAMGLKDPPPPVVVKVDGKAVLDGVWEWPAPFNPKVVTAAAAEIMKRYHLTWGTGDAYGGEWPRAEFGVHTIGYTISDLTKHEIYKAVLPVLNSYSAELTDDPATNGQLKALDRRVTANGREIIDHPPNGHDDRINAAAGAIELAYRLGPWQDDPQVAREITTTTEIFERELREMEEEQSYQSRDSDGFYDRFQG
jgi:hypothetical protein